MAVSLTMYLVPRAVHLPAVKVDRLLRENDTINIGKYAVSGDKYTWAYKRRYQLFI